MKPRVALLSAFITPYRSGAEACVEEVAARLQDRYDITIVTSRMRHDLPVHDRLASGVPVIRVGNGNKRDKWRFPFLGARAAIDLQPDLVHAVLESYAGLALMRCRAFAPQVPRILTCQSTNTRFLLKAMHRAATRVTAISSVLVHRAERFGVPADLIPNGIDLESFRVARQEQSRVFGRLLYVGRLEPMKGVDTLLEALAMICRQHGGLHLRIVGDGSERSKLEHLARRLSITHSVEFLGALPPSKIPEEMAQAEIFCGLSRSEALGNVFIEAQAAGCAVVATTVGGIPDIVHDGKTGILVRPNDPLSVAHTIMRLLTDSELRPTLAKAGMANAEAYDWSGVADRYAAVYDAVIA